MAQAAFAIVRGGTGTAGDLLFPYLAGVGGAAVLFRAAASHHLRRHAARSKPGLARPRGPAGFSADLYFGADPLSRSTRPGRAAVRRPSAITSCPLTITSRTPSAYWCGLA